MIIDVFILHNEAHCHSQQTNTRQSLDESNFGKLIPATARGQEAVLHYTTRVAVCV